MKYPIQLHDRAHKTLFKQVERTRIWPNAELPLRINKPVNPGPCAWLHAHLCVLNLLGVEGLQTLQSKQVQMEEGETERKMNVSGNRETEMNDKYSVSKHHISFCLPYLTLLISLLPNLCPSLRRQREWKEVREKKGKILTLGGLWRNSSLKIKKDKKR